MSIFQGKEDVVKRIKEMQLGARPKVSDMRKGDKLVLKAITTNDAGEPRIVFTNAKTGKEVNIALISFAAMRLCEAGKLPTAEWSMDLRSDENVKNVQDLIASEEGLKQLVAGATFECVHTAKIANLNAKDADNVPTLNHMSYSGYPEFSRASRALFASGEDVETINNQYNDLVSKLQSTEPKKTAFLTDSSRFVTLPVFTITVQ